MAHYSNITLIELRSLFEDSEISIFYHHHFSEKASGTVTFRVINKYDKNFIERKYIPFKLSGRSSRRFVSIESVVRELETFYNFRIYHKKK